MKNFLVFAILAIGFVFIQEGCMSYYATSMNEAFPARNSDPRFGVIIVDNDAPVNVFIYDQADRLIFPTYFEGQNPHIKIEVDGLRQVRAYSATMPEIGSYRVEVFPFYYQEGITGRYKVDLPRKQYSINVDRDPTDYLVFGNYVGWVLNLYQGEIPKSASPFPFFKVELKGNFRGERGLR